MTEITLPLVDGYLARAAHQTLTAMYLGVQAGETIVVIGTGIETEIVTGTGTGIAIGGIATVTATEIGTGTETETESEKESGTEIEITIVIVIVHAETMMTSQKWTLTATCRVAAD